MYNTGVVKGGTTYRAGTMTAVLSDKSSSDNVANDNTIPKTNAPKRPKTLTCDVYHLTVSGDKWIVLVGLLGEDPYEIFAFEKKNINLSEKFKHGKLTKVRKGKYDLELDGVT